MIWYALLFLEINALDTIQAATFKTYLYTLFCKGFTALAMANKEGHTDIAELLKEHGEI